MTIKGFDYLFTENQLHEQFHETPNGSAGHPQFMVFCDAVSAADNQGLTRSSQAAATLAEETLTEFLEKQTTIDEEKLQLAFKKTNDKILEFFGDENSGVAVSGVVMVLIPNAEGKSAETFLVAGVGDVRVYRIDRNKAELVFFDPQAPEIGAALGPEERSLALTNALGLDAHVRVTVRKTEQATFQRYLLMTYGAYASLSGEQIHQIGLHPHDPLQGVATTLKNFQEKRHMVRVCTATYEQNSGVQITKEKPMLESTDEPRSSSGRKRLTTIALAGAMGVLALTVGMKYTGSTAATTSQSPRSVTETTEQKAAAPTATVEEGSNLGAAADLDRERTLRMQLEQQLEQVRNELKEFVSQSPATGGAVGQEELDTLRREKRMLASQLDAVKKQLAQSGTGQASTGSQEFAALQERYQALRDESATKLSALQASYEQERRRAKELEAQMARGVTPGESGSYDLMDQARGDALEANLEAERAAKKQLEDKVAIKDEQIALLEKRLAATSASVSQAVLEAKAQLGQEASGVQTALIQAQARVKELEAFMEETGGRRGGSRAQRAELTRLRAEVLALNKQLKENEMRPQQDSNVAKLMQDVQNLTTAYGIAQSKIQELNQAFALARQESDTLRAQLSNPNRNLDAESASQVEALQSELADAKNRANALEEQLAEVSRNAEQRIAQRSANNDQSRQVAELTARTRELQNERVRLLQEKASLMESLTKVDDLQAMYDKERAARLASEQALANAQQSRTTGAPMATTTPSAVAAAPRALAMSDVTAGVAQPQNRVHVVRAGETLSGISVQYYGKANRMDDIFEANRDVLRHKNQIRAGMQLVIPEA